MDDFRTNLFELILDQTGLGAGDLSDSSALMSSGLIDSFGLVTVLSLVEELLGHEIPPADLTLENFDSPERIMAYVRQQSA